MGRLRYLADLAGWWMLGAVALVLAGCGSSPEEPRDLLLLTLDTLRWDALGCGGASRAASPALDRLAREGVQCSRAYTAIPITNSSHATILTGTWPATHGCRDFGGAWREKVPTLAELLRPHGFGTAAFVAGYPLQREISGLDRGFDRYDDGWLADPEVAERSAGATVDAALEFLAGEDAPERLFLWVHLFDPHKPYNPPDEMGRRYVSGYSWLDRPGIQEQPRRLIGLGAEPEPAGEEPPPPDLGASRGRYAGEVAYLDREVDRLLAGFQEHRGLERTLVVALADHGESFEHGYYYRHIHKLYEPLIRIPLILWGPGLPGGRLLDDPVRTVDLLPTMVELLGLPAPSGAQGRSLIDRIRGGGGPEPSAVWAETPAGSPGRWGGPYVSLIRGRYKLIRSLGTRREELYELEADPGELRDRLDPAEPPLDRDSREILAGLRSEMDQLLAARDGDPAEEPSPVLHREAREKLQSLGYLQ